MQILKNIVRNTIFVLPIVVPIVFVMMFFGYFRVNYDIILNTGNVKGEGICQTYVCSDQGPAAFYKVEFYFGSKLEKATIKGYHYDVDQIHLITSDVSEFEITGLDSYVQGIHLAHINPEEILPDGEEQLSDNGSISSRDGVLYVKVKDPNVGLTVSIRKPFIPVWFWIAYFIIMLAITILFTLILGYVFQQVPVIELPFLNVTCIAVVLLAGCFFCGSLPYVTYVNFLLNWLFLVAIALLINGLTLPWLGTVLTMMFTTFWYIANYYVIIFRGKPIMPADIKAIGTAAEVMGGYSFEPSWKMILSVVVVILYMVLLIVVWEKNRKKEHQLLRKQIIVRGITVASAILLIVIGVNTNTFKNLNSFAWDGMLLKSFHEEGMVLTYLKSLYNSKVDKPKGYSKEIVDSYLKEYQSSSEKKTKGVKPKNIIMVMNEAFADLRIVGLDKRIDVMPFIDSLNENTTEGRLNVAVFGGGTCNTEFEALTGNTLAFLGPGAYPYTENVTDSMFSLAKYFKDHGYATEAFHANDAKNWNRNMVYPFFGFDTFHSIEDYESSGYLTYLHAQPSDISDYKYIESMSKKYYGEKRFLFNVTMQNHSPYDRWLDVNKAKSVEDNGSSLYVDTQIYLSMIKASDDEVKQLVETYTESDEPTMIIFFGDHQPGLPVTAINEIYTGIKSNLDFYKSKFFIWTNYKTKTVHGAEISANYLPWLILNRGNFPLPPYIQMLKEVHEKYPIISSQGLMDADGNIYPSVADVADDPLIQKYQYVQYANMFDEIDQAWFEIKQ